MKCWNKGHNIKTHANKESKIKTNETLLNWRRPTFISNIWAGDGYLERLLNES